MMIVLVISNVRKLSCSLIIHFILEPCFIGEGCWDIRLTSLLGILCTNLWNQIFSTLTRRSVNAGGQLDVRCEGACVCACVFL